MTHQSVCPGRRIIPVQGRIVVRLPTDYIRTRGALGDYKRVKSSKLLSRGNIHRSPKGPIQWTPKCRTLILKTRITNQIITTDDNFLDAEVIEEDFTNHGVIESRPNRYTGRCLFTCRSLFSYHIMSPAGASISLIYIHKLVTTRQLIPGSLNIRISMKKVTQIYSLIEILLRDVGRLIFRRIDHILRLNPYSDPVPFTSFHRIRLRIIYQLTQ